MTHADDILKPQTRLQSTCFGIHRRKFVLPRQTAGDWTSPETPLPLIPFDNPVSRLINIKFITLGSNNWTCGGRQVQNHTEIVRGSFEDLGLANLTGERDFHPILVIGDSFRTGWI
mgnify:CR=1 FL=1